MHFKYRWHPCFSIIIYVHLKMFAVPEGEKPHRGGRGQDCQRESLQRGSSPQPRVQDPIGKNLHNFIHLHV